METLLAFLILSLVPLSASVARRMKETRATKRALYEYVVAPLADTHVIRLDTNSANHVSRGRITVSLAAPDTAAGVSLDSPGLVSGETAATVVDLVNTSSRRSTVALTTIATSSSLLDQDPVNGLQLAIDRCSAPWEPVPGATRPGYRCPGRTVSVLVRRPVLVSNLALSNLDAGDQGGKQHLCLSLTLPESAGNEFQGLSSTIQYRFTALRSWDAGNGVVGDELPETPLRSFTDLSAARVSSTSWRGNGKL